MLMLLGRCGTGRIDPGFTARALSFVIGAILVLCGLYPASAMAQTSYRIDPSTSTLEIHVYKAGLLTAFGHEHLVVAQKFSGAVQFDPRDIQSASVTLRVFGNSLAVVDPGESANDRNQVQTTMRGPAVLDTVRYPEIVFRSTGITQFLRQEIGWRVVLTGVLQLHGMQKTVSLSLKLRVANGDLIAEGDAYLLQSDFGIHPIRVAGGLVKVKDRLRIHFEIRAIRTGADVTSTRVEGFKVPEKIAKSLTTATLPVY